MSINKTALDHLAGRGVIVKHWYANVDQPGTATVSTRLPSDEELAVWEEAAFTNGDPLVKIEIIWAPAEAAKLKQSRL